MKKASICQYNTARQFENLSCIMYQNREKINSVEKGTPNYWFALHKTGTGTPR